MSVPETINPQKNDCLHQTAQFFLTWTPRIIVAGFAGYYSLGIAYDVGIMAAIDRLAISILRDSIGYAGIGAAMPTFQWYSAWAVRTVAAGGAGLIYDLLERLTVFVYSQLQSCLHGSNTPSSLTTEPIQVLVRNI